MKNLVGHDWHARLLLGGGRRAGVAADAWPSAKRATPHTEKLDTIWTVPEVGALPDDDYGRLVRRGRDLVTATYAHIGPDVSDPAKRYAGNNLACGNCHLEAGTKRFGLPIFGLYDAFPRYSAREGTEITIEQRVNSCMTRSMNGRAIPDDAPEMAAFVAYVKFLSSGVPPDQRIPGLGAGNIPELNRAADPARGRTIYLAQMRGLSQHRRVGHPPQPADHRSRLHGAAALGTAVVQRWRRHGPADHRGEFRPFQHAARRGLSESGAVAGGRVGCRGFRRVAAAAAQGGAGKGLPRSGGQAGRYAVRALSSTALARRSTNTARSHRSAPRSRA